MKTTTLTKEEFIKRSMDGDRFRHDGRIFHYVSDLTIPFRINDLPIIHQWYLFNGKTIFEIVEPKPKIERRWKWRKDFDEYTTETDDYVSDEYEAQLRLKEDGYYKTDIYIDVEVK